VSARIGTNDLHVGYHAQILESSGLLRQAGVGDAGQALYVARLRHFPCWVKRMVNQRLLQRDNPSQREAER
jgi:hypothetical protein